MPNNFNLEKRIRRIDEKVSKIANDIHEQTKQPNEQKETWVKYSIIKYLTGWDRIDLRRARRNGIVKTKKDGKGLSYLLESLDPIFYKKR